MDEETLKVLEKKFTSVVDEVMGKKLPEAVGPAVANEVKKIVEQMRVERALFGKDLTGLSEEKKITFVNTVKVALGMKLKSGEAMIEEVDDRGGYLVSTEVANAIVRIAASVGLIMSQAQKWPMASDQLDIPAYAGSFLEGEYLGVDAAGSMTAVTFSKASLIVKKWQLAFVVANDLIGDANVDLADWLLALAGEALANRIDKEGFAGVGSPFVGLLENADVTTHNLASGANTFEEYDVVDDSLSVIADVEESMLDGAAFYMNRTVWAKLRVQKDSSGSYKLPNQGAPSPAILAAYPGSIKPAGEISGYPVFTNRHFPTLSVSGASKKFIVFGNLKALAYGDKEELRVAQHQSGSFGGKEIALADQIGIVYKHRHALVIALPAAFSVVKTAAA